MKIVLIDEDEKKSKEYDLLEMELTTKPEFKDPMIQGDDLIRAIYGDDFKTIKLKIKGKLREKK